MLEEKRKKTEKRAESPRRESLHDGNVAGKASYLLVFPLTTKEKNSTVM
jgi:hypothetical protein